VGFPPIQFLFLRCCVAETTKPPNRHFAVAGAGCFVLAILFGVGITTAVATSAGVTFVMMFVIESLLKI